METILKETTAIGTTLSAMDTKMTDLTAEVNSMGQKVSTFQNILDMVDLQLERLNHSTRLYQNDVETMNS